MAKELSRRVEDRNCLRPKPPNPGTQKRNVPKNAAAQFCLSAWRVFDAAGVASVHPSARRDSRSIAIRGIKISKERKRVMNSDSGPRRGSPQCRLGRMKSADVLPASFGPCRLARVAREVIQSKGKGHWIQGRVPLKRCTLA